MPVTKIPTILCSLFLYLSSLLVKTTTDDVKFSISNFSSVCLSCSTWYLQQGSYCHEILYNVIQDKLIAPIGMQNVFLNLRGKVSSDMMHPRPERTPALCKKFPI